MQRQLTLIISGVLLVGLFSVGGSVALFTLDPDPVVPSSPAAAPPSSTAAPQQAYADAGSDRTLRHAAEPDITGAQPRIMANASIGSLDTDQSGLLGPER